MKRLELIREMMKKNAVDSVLLSDFTEVTWATGFTGDDSHCVITAEDALFFTDSRYTEQAGEQVSDYSVIETGYADRHKAISVYLFGRVGIDFERTSVSELEEYKEAFDVKGFFDVSSEFTALRAIKNEEEISHMKEGARITEGAFEHMLEIIKPGISEKDIYAEMIYYFNRHGADPSFTPIIASGENGSKPHAVVTDRVIKNGDLITMDFGVKYKGVCTDFTRTIAVGGIEKEKLLVYNTVKNAQYAALCALKPGITGAEADSAARRVIDDAGYKEYFGHGTGHGVGLEIHEAPRLSRASGDILKPGMVVTDEPGIYLPGKFGVRIEDMILITEDGYENFYTADKEIIII